MFIKLLAISVLLTIISVQSAVLNNSQSQSPAIVIVPKQASSFDHYDLNDLTTAAEGSGDGAANLDDYVDEDDDNQLSKVTATTISSTSTTTTTKRSTTKIQNSTKVLDLDANEFDEDYKDDLDDNVDYNEVTTKSIGIPLSSTRPLPPPIERRPTSLRELFSFLTRPAIAAGILAGLAIGILTSVILLICLVQRFQKRQRSHSSYTTGLLYPNQYGYSKSPQEFYA
ncbi:unnamed protein product [Adineta steineri]|uniref:Syndecan n=1 Tax=Adineta steineri TaxID=433720 RepID=A0A818JD45_9BILA|nr:unnamed protein product [Adineta steineri]CAF3534210.1 unnamed protein product [Adineta steineri]